MDNQGKNYFSENTEINLIRENTQIRNIEYSTGGDLLSYTVGDSLKIHSTLDGSVKNIITVEISTMKFFQKNTILISHDNTIRHLSIHDNRFLAVFTGHAGKITSLSVNSQHDLFMSIGPKEANVWDVRMSDPLRKVVARDQIGALSCNNQYSLCNNNILKIFDMRYEAGPVSTVMIQPNFYRKFWFTADGEAMAIAGAKDYTFFDKEGNMLSYIAVEEENNGDTTPDSSTLLCCSKKYIFAYRILDRKRIGTLETSTQNNYVIRANPVSPGFICASSDSVCFYK